MFKIYFPKWREISAKLKEKFNIVKDFFLKLFNKVDEFFRSSFNAVKGVKTKVLAIVTSAVLCFTVTVVAYASDLREAVEVYFNGESYGYVADIVAAKSVEAAIRKDVFGISDDDTFKFEAATVESHTVLSVDKLVQDLSKRCKSFKSVCGLYVDDKLVAVGQSLDSVKASLRVGEAYFTPEGFEFKGYVNSVSFANIFVKSNRVNELLIDTDKVLNGQYGILFKAVRTENYDEVIKHKQIIEYNDKKYVSYKKVTQKGEDGLRKVTANIIYINGEKSEVKELDSVTVKEAVDEKITKGTLKGQLTSGRYVLVSKILDRSQATLTFPTKVSNRCYISSFWGDGRGHKGIDIACPSGTEIYAAADGVVTYSGYKGDYGYTVMIKHSDGKIKTLYSHNRKNLVKNGETVKAGQVIALVGQTGNATGNHVHFEVIDNGTKVDPARYVGLK